MADGVAVAFFWNKKVGNCYTGAYKKSGKRGIITKVEDYRKLVEIDGKPALDVVAGWLGSDKSKLQGFDLLFATIPHPLGVQDIASEHIWIRHPMVGNADGSLNVGNRLEVGTTIELMDATTDELINSVTGAVECAKKRLGSEIGALIAVHCGGRRAGIGDRIEEVNAKLKASCGDVPFIGVFTFGEYGYEDWTANGCGGLMLSFMALAK